MLDEVVRPDKSSKRKKNSTYIVDAIFFVVTRMGFEPMDASVKGW